MISCELAGSIVFRLTETLMRFRSASQSFRKVETYVNQFT
jgi:hypothetical protein